MTRDDPPIPGFHLSVEAAADQLRETLERMRDARFANGLACPRCRSDRCVRWGSFARRQRYRCRGCSRTFSDLTGTPAAYTKRLSVWGRFGRCLRAAVSVRKAAIVLGVHPSTAFRWRHAVLAGPIPADDPFLARFLELETAWFPWSEKGQRKTTREPRKRGLPRRSAETRDGVSVVIACDRVGHVVTAMVGRAHSRKVGPLEVQRVGPHAPARPTIAAADGSYSPAARLARLCDGRFVDTRRALRPPPPLAHLRTAREYRRRLYGWMPRFRGVATKYLENYLRWHRLIDRAERCDAAATSLWWAFETGPG